MRGLASNAAKGPAAAGARHRTRAPRGLRGAAAVEFALVSIPVFLFVFAVIEFGRALMCIQCLEEAARAGCRVAVLKSATANEVQTEIGNTLRTAGITRFSVTISAANLDTVAQWAPVSVEVTARFGDMSWMPLPNYFGNRTYTATCTFPREAEPAA